MGYFVAHICWFFRFSFKSCLLFSVLTSREATDIIFPSAIRLIMGSQPHIIPITRHFMPSCLLVRYTLIMPSQKISVSVMIAMRAIIKYFFHSVVSSPCTALTINNAISAAK